MGSRYLRFLTKKGKAKWAGCGVLLRFSWRFLENNCSKGIDIVIVLIVLI